MPGRPQLPLDQSPPTDAERRAGDVFFCPGCRREWPFRHKHPREWLCVGCGRALVRARKQAQRARAHGDVVDTPSVPTLVPVLVNGVVKSADEVLATMDRDEVRQIDIKIEAASKTTAADVGRLAIRKRSRR